MKLPFLFQHFSFSFLFLLLVDSFVFSNCPQIELWNTCKIALAFKDIYAILIAKLNEEGGNMAKAKCAAKTTKGKKCKNPASGKSKYCVTHKKK
jgi:hypothetical protein